jgi:NAD(P)-dependent dehydrogenase (short-subunit alcohol dehydrogenase family)
MTMNQTAQTAPATGRVAGKTAVVTGGRGDLGSATVRLLAEHGARVASLDMAGTPAVVRHPDVTEYDVDVTNADSVAAVLAAVRSDLGAPGILVNAAGIIGPSGPSHTAGEKDFDLLFDVNVKGVWLMTKHTVPAMIDAGTGSIINFSSIHGITGGKNVPLYHATKGAVRLLTKSDAAAYGGHGIRVNSIHPGFIETDMLAQGGFDDEDHAKMAKRVPLGRIGQPHDIANVVLFLATDASAYITGQELVVDGGVHG